jgi:hypothetical protein
MANQDVKEGVGGQHNAAHPSREHNAPVQNNEHHLAGGLTNEGAVQGTPLMEPISTHSAFINESEPSHSAFTNEPELAQPHNHDDAMIDIENAAVESQEPLTSNTAAGRRDGYLRC